MNYTLELFLTHFSSQWVYLVGIAKRLKVTHKFYLKGISVNHSSMCVGRVRFRQKRNKHIFTGNQQFKKNDFWYLILCVNLNPHYFIFLLFLIFRPKPKFSDEIEEEGEKDLTEFYEENTKAELAKKCQDQVAAKILSVMFGHMAMYEDDDTASEYSESDDDEEGEEYNYDAPSIHDRINLFESGTVAQFQTPVRKR